jgi:hypothetical protein
MVWVWCIAYTAMATPPARERRRGEICSHLWESERAALKSGAVLFAAMRGALHDLGWAMGSGIPRLVRSFGTPTPYIVAAPVFPIQAWIVSAVAGGAVGRPEEMGAIGGGAMLALAAAAWLWQRRRG